MLEELLNLLRLSATTLETSPVADQARQDVKDAEEIVAKHVKNAETEVAHWLATRMHRVLGGETAPPAA